MPASIIPISKAADESLAPRHKPRDLAIHHLQQAMDSGVRGSLRDAIQAALGVAAAPRKRDITELEYEALKPGQKLVDHTRPGFLARATRRGTRFAYRHRDPVTSKQTETHIGYLGSISLADARASWENLRAQRMDGARPELAQAETLSTLPTMAALVTRYLDDYASKVKRSWRDDQRLLHKHVLPDYGDLPADAFTTGVARALFQSLDDTPRERDKLRASLSALFNVAVGKTTKLTIAEPWLPLAFQNPITNTTTAKHNADVYAPTPAEARLYATRLRSAALRQDVRDVLQLQLLCASRVTEVAGMEWAEVCLERGEWTLPAARSKNGKAHTVLLSTQARALVERRRNFAAPDARFVFPSPTRHTRAIRSDLVQHTLADQRAALGVDKRFTSHNVRHAFTTWAAEQETPVEVVNRCTAHVVATGINARYNFAKLNRPAQALWQAWGDFLDG